MIKVSPVQRGNKLLDCLGRSMWHYDNSCAADYEVNNNVFALFLSLKFHASKPEYIYKRINRLKFTKLKVLLVLVDVPNYNLTIQELLDRVSITVILCKTLDECSRYLRGFDIGGRVSNDTIRRKEQGLDAFLESIPTINSSNVVNLKKTYDDLQDLFRSDEKKLGNVFGLGQQKAKNVLKYLKMPFKKSE